MNTDYKTVLKYVDMDNFSQQFKVKAESEPCSKLNPWKPQIDEWLKADLDAPRKQRHTALRVFERLSEMFEDFNCSYRTVATYVKLKRDELRLTVDEPMLPLVHWPGECQGDFGAADFIENGMRISGKFFVLDFPHSNCAFAQLKYGENMECLLESLDAIFRFIGGVPKEIWFDNASTMVIKVIRGGGRKINERFLRFAEHYRFCPVFMNPFSGNEKGGVESKVGYIRRHMLVPIPEMTSLSSFNEHFFQIQSDDLVRYHYRKDKLLTDLFLDDIRELLPLPSFRFDLADYRVFRTDQTAMFTVDGKFTYSSHPDLRRKKVIVRFTSSEVTVFDEYMKEVVVHRRLYGEEIRTSMNWIPYLRAIAKKPRSFLNTGIAEYMPEEMRVYLLRCDNSDRGKILNIMADLNDEKGFEAVRSLVSIAVEMNAMDPDNFELLYRRLYLEIPTLSPLNLPSGTPNVPSMTFDLSLYDSLLKGKDEE
jgi:transposase